MSYTNKRFSGAQKLKARPDLDIERRPEGGPKVDTQQVKARKKPYGFTGSAVGHAGEGSTF